MIFVECKPDQTLVLAVTGATPRQVIHELQGKAEVVRRLSGGTNLLGMVDEDPWASQPPYLSRMRMTEDLPAAALKVFQDPNRNNRIAVLCPRLEEWILRAARLERANLGDYNLPADVSRLREVINHRLPNLERLVNDLRGSASMRALRRALTA